jgi:hypothetical protein
MLLVGHVGEMQSILSPMGSTNSEHASLVTLLEFDVAFHCQEGRWQKQSLVGMTIR